MEKDCIYFKDGMCCKEDMQKECDLWGCCYDDGEP